MTFKPFIPSEKTIPELTIVPLILGTLLGIIFGASSLYLALKVGLTVSASIPVAVLSVTLFRAFSKIFKIRKATILENNVVQTAGSAGESIAFGIGVTMPALLILGTDMSLSRTMLVAVLGALLGVLLMIPLRRALIVKEHGKLAYPEGTACAEVLISGEMGGTTAATVFTGFFVGLIYKILNVGTKLWIDIPEKIFSKFKGANISADVSPELLGVGFIIGPRIASTMVAGGVLSSLVLTPMIILFGESLTVPLFPSAKLISQMSIREIWGDYILYIGAGAVTAGGIISLVRSLPTIIRGAVGGLKSFSAEKSSVRERTDTDLPMSVVLIGCAGLILFIMFSKPLHMNFLGALLILIFGFLFVTVSSRLTGEVGSSSNPISGMTVATLLLTCLVFLGLGWVSPQDRVTAMCVAAIVCVASAVGGATSQDLKTGFLVGATPKNQQIAILIGALASAIVIGYTLKLLNDASTVYSNKDLPPIRVENVETLTEREGLKGPEATRDNKIYRVLRITEIQTTGPLTGLIPGKYLVNDDGTLAYNVDPGINGTLKTRDNGAPVQKYDAPKARLMSLIIDGILTQKLPWTLVLLGVLITVVLELCGVSSLAFAVGVYLPISVSAPIFVGGATRWFAERVGKSASSDDAPGVLLSSGLIAGGAIGGITIAMLSLSESLLNKMNLSSYFPWSGNPIFSIFMFGLLVAFLFFVSTGRLLGDKKR